MCAISRDKGTLNQGISRTCVSVETSDGSKADLEGRPVGVSRWMLTGEKSFRSTRRDSEVVVEMRVRYRRQVEAMLEQRTSCAVHKQGFLNPLTVF